MKKEKVNEDINAKEKIPSFLFFYSFLVFVLLIAFFLVMFLFIVLPEKSSKNTMINALLVVQLIGLGYIIPFYLVPEIYGVVKFVKYRKRNITLMGVVSLFYALFYPLFQLGLFLFGK